MQLTRKDYTKVPGQSRSSFSIIRKSHLLIAEDHLLIVTTDYIGENYRSIFFRDITAIISRNTARRSLINVILAILIALLLSLVFFTIDNQDLFYLSAIFVGIIDAILLILMLINTVKGTRCITDIRTRVQTLRLSSISNVRKRSKSIEFIEERIKQAQPLPPPVISSTNVADIQADDTTSNFDSPTELELNL